MPALRLESDAGCGAGEAVTAALKPSAQPEPRRPLDARPFIARAARPRRDSIAEAAAHAAARPFCSFFFFGSPIILRGAQS